MPVNQAQAQVDPSAAASSMPPAAAGPNRFSLKSKLKYLQKIDRHMAESFLIF